MTKKQLIYVYLLGGVFTVIGSVVVLCLLIKAYESFHLFYLVMSLWCGGGVGFILGIFIGDYTLNRMKKLKIKRKIKRLDEKEEGV